MPVGLVFRQFTTGHFNNTYYFIIIFIQFAGDVNQIKAFVTSIFLYNCIAIIISCSYGLEIL